MRLFRNLFCAGVLLLTSALATAQTSKGSWLIGGSGSLGYQFSEFYPNTFTATINPRIGYFVGNNIVLGLSLPEGFSRRGNGEDVFPVSSGRASQLVWVTKHTITGLGAGPFFRKYFGTASLRPLIEAQATYQHTIIRTTSQEGNRFRNTSYNYALEGGAGVSYFVTDHVGLEAILSGQYANGEVRSANPVQIRLNIGIQFYLPRR